MKNLHYFPILICLLVCCKNEPSLKSDSQTVDRTVVFEGITDSIKPGDNFFDHVNRTWFNEAVIAEDQVGVGSYRFLNIPQQELLKNILQEVSQQENPKGSIEQKVGDFYASGMDTLSIDARGITPIQPLLDQIEAIKDISC